MIFAPFMYVYRAVHTVQYHTGAILSLLLLVCEREPQTTEQKIPTYLTYTTSCIITYSTSFHPHSPFPHGRVCFFLSPSPQTRVRLEFEEKKIMPNIKTIELPLGDTTARCTIELPDPATRPQDPAAVVDFTYDLVAWVVKIASEITSTKELQVSTANHHHHHHHDPQQHSGTRQVRIFDAIIGCETPNNMLMMGEIGVAHRFQARKAA